MKIRLMFLVVILLCSWACKTTQPCFVKESDFKEIRSVLSSQQAAWNSGSLDKFMEGYWDSPQLAFIGSKGVTRGWDQTLSNYRKGYSDRAAMGNLKFDIIELKSLGPQSCLMIGQYTLTRENDTPSGYFSLIWEKIDGQWLITTDHTSG